MTATPVELIEEYVNSQKINSTTEVMVARSRSSYHETSPSYIYQILDKSRLLQQALNHYRNLCSRHVRLRRKRGSA